MIFKPTPIKSRSKAPTNIRKIFFDKKGVELINLPRILHDQSVLSILPSNTKIVFHMPTAVYNVEPSVLSTIFNFNKYF